LPKAKDPVPPAQALAPNPIEICENSFKGLSNPKKLSGSWRNGSKAMTKRGRPPANGCQKKEIFFRALEILDLYNQFRGAGQKHSCAVLETVEALRGKYKVSNGTVKRTLAKWQGRDHKTAFIVSKPISNEIFLLDGRECRPTLALGIGPRPTYPRVNASQRVSDAPLKSRKNSES
jgi:hypothetical protein